MNKKYILAFFIGVLISFVSLSAMEEFNVGKKVNVNKKLEEVVGCGGDKVVALHWLDKGANPNFRMENGDRLLHEAIFWRQAAIVNILLARGADPKQRDTSGKTPWQLARAEGRGDIIDLLYVYGVKR